MVSPGKEGRGKDARKHRHHRSLALAAVASCVLVPACNWMTFADDASKAPVRSISAPGTFKSGDFGQLLVPLSNGLGKAAAFLATSINDSNVVVMTIDAAGNVSSAPIPKTALDDTRDSEITAIAEIPDTNPMRIIFGTPEITGTGFGRVYTYLLTPALEGAANPIIVPGFATDEPGLGRGLAVGRLGGAENIPDYLVTADDRLGVAVDVANGAPVNGTTTVAGGAAGCDVADDPAQEARYKVRRPLLTARLWDDPPGTTTQQVIVGATHAASAGKLSFFSVSGDATAPALNCLTTFPAPGPGMKSQFGRALAVGDFNNDKANDLLVGAPGNEAYVFLGPFPTGGVPAPIRLSNPMGDDIDFGFAVAALNVDGTPGDEALVGDPRATMGGHEKAGRVLAFHWDAESNTMKVIDKMYSDHAPESNANFGTTLNVLNFCTALVAGTPCADTATARLLMIGASNEVFLYYREGDNIPLRLRDGTMVPDVRTP